MLWGDKREEMKVNGRPWKETQKYICLGEIIERDKRRDESKRKNSERNLERKMFRVDYKER